MYRAVTVAVCPRTDPAGTVIVYVPVSEETPAASVPDTVTFAPPSACPPAAVTRPVIVACCAESAAAFTIASVATAVASRRRFPTNNLEGTLIISLLNGNEETAPLPSGGVWHTAATLRVLLPVT